MIELTAVGGYNEVGRNMTAVKVGNDVVVLDIGLYMENYIQLNNDDDLVKNHFSNVIDLAARLSIDLLD